MDGQIKQLLADPPSALLEENYAQVTAGLGLEVRLDAGEGKGKGVFATQAFKKGSLLLREPPLAAIQHTANRPLAWVCAHCFRFLGSIEQQTARQIMSGLYTAQEGSEGPSSDTDSSDDGKRGGAAAIGEEQLGQLADGSLKLPHTADVPLPVPARCPGGCLDEWYCSDTCAEAAWQQYHQLLCPGPDEAEPQQGEAGSAAGGGNRGKAPATAAVEPSEQQEAQQRRQLALREFLDYADETNDVFRLAAIVMAQVLIAADQHQQKQVEKNGGGSSSSSSGGGIEPSADLCWQALLVGWQPFAAGHKGVWWECTGAPPEAAADMRRLAEDSLGLLLQALPPHLPRRYPALLSLPVWGNVIGMFELNNLDLFVASPIQRWLHLLDALPAAEQEAALEAAGTFINALPEELPGCEGNAFFTLHSCCNHSCSPNAEAFKGDEDEDGCAVILALRDIEAGEEVTLSYIPDEEAPLEKRREQLAGYGFQCACDKCQAEELQLEAALQLE